MNAAQRGTQNRVQTFRPLPLGTVQRAPLTHRCAARLANTRWLQGFLLALLMICGSAIESPVFAADTSYRHPGQPSFTLLVPDGWTATRNDHGVTLARGAAFAVLRVLGGIAEPGAMLVQLRPQFERQEKNYREIDSGTVMFGGQRGGYAVHSSVPPSGVSGITKVVTMTNGRLTYLLAMEAPIDLYDQVKGDMERIQASFAPDPVR